MIVVDASLAVKWVIDETDSPAALALLAREWENFTGPDLLGIEVASAVSRRANLGDITGSDALLAMSKWVELVQSIAVRLEPTSPQHLLAAVQLAVELRHPLKDCLYIVMAIETEAVLASCDRRLLEKAGRVHGPVAHLAELAMPENGDDI